MAIVTVFGKDAYGLNQIDALNTLFKGRLQMTLLLFENVEVSSELLANLIGCRCEEERVAFLIQEMVEDPLVEAEGISPVLVGATFIMDIWPASGEPGQISQSEFFKDMEQALGIGLEVLVE